MKRKLNFVVPIMCCMLMVFAAAMLLLPQQAKAEGTVAKSAAKQMSGTGFGGWSQATFAMDTTVADKAAVWANVGSAAFDYNEDYFVHTRGETALGGATRRMFFQNGFVGFTDYTNGFQDGDKLELKAGLRSFYWTGGYGGNAIDPAGEGEYIAICELDNDVTYVLTDGAWVQIDGEKSNTAAVVREMYEKVGATFGLRISVALPSPTNIAAYANEWQYSQVEKYITYSSDSATFRAIFVREDVFDIQLLTGSFSDGDVLTFAEGLPFYKYSGTINGAAYEINNDGNFVQVGVLSQDFILKRIDGIWQPYAANETDAEAKLIQADLTVNYGAGIAFRLTDEMGDNKGVRLSSGFIAPITEAYIEYTPGAGGKIPENGWDYVFCDSSYIIVRALNASGSLYASEDYAALLGEGATFTLKSGFPIYKYSGTVNGPAYAVSDDGYYTLAGRFKEDCTVRFDGENSSLEIIYNTLEIENADELSAIRKREGKQIIISGTPEGAGNRLIYSSSNTGIATVSAEGLISGISDGVATITVRSAYNDAVTDSISVTVSGAVAYTALVIEIDNAYGKVISYTGVTVNAAMLNDVVTAYYTLDGGGRSENIALTDAMLDLSSFDKDATGVQSLYVNGEESLRAAVSVEVFAVIEGNVQTPALNVPWRQLFVTVGTQSVSGQNMVMDAAFLSENNAGKILYYRSGFESLPRQVAQVMILDGNLAFLSFEDAASSGDPNVNMVFNPGDILIVKKGFSLYRYTGTMGGISNLFPQGDGEYIMTHRVAADVKYIYDGARWIVWTENYPLAQGVSAEDLTIPVGASAQVAYSISPSSALGAAILSEIGGDLLKIDGNTITGLREGVTTLRLTLGTITEDITVTLTAAQAPVGLELADGFASYFVLKGSELDITKLSARLVFAGGFSGETFALTADNTSFSLDTSAIGEQKVTITVRYGDGSETLPLEISVTVYSINELKIDSMGQAEWYGNLLMIACGSTSLNTSSIVDTEALTDVINKMVYMRGDTEIAVESFWLIEGNFVLFFETADDFKEGDTLKLLKGLTMYRWTGETHTDPGNLGIPLPGTGEYIKDAILPYEYLYTFNGESWDLYLEYTDISVREESITVGLGKTADLGAIKVPDNASTGTIKYIVADPTKVRVSSTGIVTGLAFGTTTVEVVLSGGTNGEKRLTVTVEVVDIVTAVKINVDTIYIKTGTDLDAGTLADAGVTAVFVWASGKEETASLDGVRIKGFTVDEDGTYQVTLTFAYENALFNTQLTVVANANGKAPGGCGGCSGSAMTTSMAIFALFALTGVIVLRKRKRI